MSDTQIDISKLQKCDVLAALYNRSSPLGLGLVHFTPEDMTSEQAQKIIDEMKSDGYPPKFDYLKGRVMKVDLSDDAVDTRLYDRDNGAGSGSEVIAGLRPAV